MKRLLAILLIILILFNSVGYYFIFAFNQYMIRREMRCMIQSKCFEASCTVITIPAPNINNDYRRIDDHEFEYRGVLYDIIEESATDGNITFKCIIDKQEQNLVSSFFRSSNFQNGQDNPSRAKHASAMLQHIVLIALTEKPILAPYPNSKEMVYNILHFFPNSGFLPSEFHPPQVA